MIADLGKDCGEAIRNVCARFIILCRRLIVDLKRDKPLWGARKMGVAENSARSGSGCSHLQPGSRRLVAVRCVMSSARRRGAFKT
jgi:hypothetical protein